MLIQLSLINPIHKLFRKQNKMFLHWRLQHQNQPNKLSRIIQYQTYKTARSLIKKCKRSCHRYKYQKQLIQSRQNYSKAQVQFLTLCQVELKAQSKNMREVEYGNQVKFKKKFVYLQLLKNNKWSTRKEIIILRFQQSHLI